MRKFFQTFLLCTFLMASLAISARAAENTLKVGLYYGDSALFSANLQNYRGSGYELGWFDEEARRFVPVARLEEEKISMTADGSIYISGGSYYRSRSVGCTASVGGYHVELREHFASYEEARYVAGQFRTGFVAYIDGEYRVRVSSFLTREEAEVAAATYATYAWSDLSGGVHTFVGSAVSPSATAVIITVTTTDQVLFAFDCSGERSLGVLPLCREGEALTWFKGYKWYGGFEYRRDTGGDLSIINVVEVDDYVKGVLPYEMSPTWPLEALKAQAVCARTYALWQTKHDKLGFDVCRSTDCQVYNGANHASDLTDRAVEETAGVVITYRGELAETYYCSSNGGASESSENVWSAALPYLRGRQDPYEGTISIPGYSYSETYTLDQLTRILRDKGHEVGQVQSVYVSERTEQGNVKSVTFVGSRDTLTVTGEKCKTIFYTTLFGGTKSLKSLRFTISGGAGQQLLVNGGDPLPTLSGAYTISGGGQVARYGGKGTSYVITASGVEALKQTDSTTAADTVTITGTGSGHNVGLSQYGARAMAELGRSWEDILRFYFTDIDLERAG